MINVGDSRAYFFPDRILLLQGKQFGAVSYSDLQIDSSITQFVEDESVASDTRIVAYRWRFMNKDGGPDRRFNNNHQIPVVLYGELSLRSASGLNLLLQTSRPEAAKEFRDHIHPPQEERRNERSQGAEQARSNARQKKESQSKPSSPSIADDAPTRARNLFGLDLGASREEISSAYHRLAAMYHPDKVAHLAPEFKALAEERMKEINAAFEILNSRTSI